MKEKCSFKRIDLFSVLAVFGILLVMLVEGIFIFELYRVDYSRIEPFLPNSVKAWLASVEPERPVPVQEETEPVETQPQPTNEVISADGEEAAAGNGVAADVEPAIEKPAAPPTERSEGEDGGTNAVPSDSEENSTDLESEPVPVG